MSEKDITDEQAWLEANPTFNPMPNPLSLADLDLEAMSKPPEISESKDAEAKPPPVNDNKQDMDRVLAEIKEREVKANEAMAKAVEFMETINSTMSNVLAQLPQAVESQVSQYIEQAQVIQRQQVQPQAPIEAQVETMQAQPLLTIAQMLPQILVGLKEAGIIGKPPAVNPIAALTTQLDGIAQLFHVMDAVRGNGNSPSQSFNPNTILNWVKWAHGLGKSGAPEPSFDSISITTPPGNTI